MLCFLKYKYVAIRGGSVNVLYVLWVNFYMLATFCSESTNILLPASFTNRHVVRRKSISYAVVQDEGDKKSATTLEDWSLKTEHDSKLFRQLYGMVYNCYKQKNQLCSHMLKQIMLVIHANSRILQCKQLFVSEYGEKNEAIEPLMACARLVRGADNWWGGNVRAQGYEKLLWNVVDLDTDNARRVAVIRFFIQAHKLHLVQKMLEKGTDITDSSEPVTDLVLCCSSQTPYSSTRSISDSIQSIVRMLFIEDPEHYDDEYHAQLPEVPMRFSKRSDEVQIAALEMARVLMKAKANLSGIHSTFPPADHRDECVSCCFLYNCAVEEGMQKKVT